MKLTLQVKLLPDSEQSSQLLATVERFNEAATWLAGEAFRLRSANKVAIQKTHYRILRDRFGLSAQMAVRCIAQVCEAYKRDKNKRPRFRKHASVPYDQRIMSFKGVDRVSLLTLAGRVIVPVIMGKYQQERFTNACGQSDLVLRRDGGWFLLVTVDVPDGTKPPTTDFLGVDFGVANIASTSDGDQFSGSAIEAARAKYASLRQSLSSRSSSHNSRRTRKNARRAMLRIGNKEARFRRHQNHCISKLLVVHAKDTSRGIAIEDLGGIRERTRFRKEQRAMISGWSFSQLRQFIEYKGDLYGVEVITVDPRNSSRTCCMCGHCEKRNRRSQAKFQCLACGYAEHADINAARVIAARAAVSQPKVSEQTQVKLAS